MLYCRRGCFEDTATPTLVVFVEKSDQPSWNPSFLLPTTIEFVMEQDEIILNHRRFPIWQPSVNSSACIGTETTTGTLGGYLQCEDGEVLALTCAHCCGIQDMSNNIQKSITQPSIQSIREARNEPHSDERTKQKIPSENTSPWGIVKYNQYGFDETKAQKLLDWALIKVHCRRGVNMFPVDFVGLISSSEISSMSLLQADEIVWKEGFTTGMTTGRYNGMEFVRYDDGRIYTEHAVISVDETHFSLPGDSGAFVFNADGICGMLYGATKNHSVTLVFNMSLLVQHIEEVTGKKWHILSSEEKSSHITDCFKCCRRMNVEKK
jgi:hypothetical protein